MKKSLLIIVLALVGASAAANSHCPSDIKENVQNEYHNYLKNHDFTKSTEWKLLVAEENLKTYGMFEPFENDNTAAFLASVYDAVVVKSDAGQAIREIQQEHYLYGMTDAKKALLNGYLNQLRAQVQESFLTQVQHLFPIADASAERIVVGLTNGNRMDIERQIMEPAFLGLIGGGWKTVSTIFLVSTDSFRSVGIGYESNGYILYNIRRLNESYELKKRGVLKSHNRYGYGDEIKLPLLLSEYAERNYPSSLLSCITN